MSFSKDEDIDDILEKVRDAIDKDYETYVTDWVDCRFIFSMAGGDNFTRWSNPDFF